ncbi:hypothetical protein [Limnohabitans sp. DM1]|uniref:hypothetical protein n=1 Tax=Limnohabitans sp. DM1 TaxID=1597955 RepID=UPI001E650B6E|nr:hypothetical protein [Limnohabitans sp. DM1]
MAIIPCWFEFLTNRMSHWFKNANNVKADIFSNSTNISNTQLGNAHARLPVTTSGFAGTAPADHAGSDSTGFGTSPCRLC